MKVNLPQPDRESDRDYQPIILQGIQLQANGALYPGHNGKPEIIRFYIDNETGVLVLDVAKYEANLRRAKGVTVNG